MEISGFAVSRNSWGVFGRKSSSSLAVEERDGARHRMAFGAI